MEVRDSSGYRRQGSHRLRCRSSRGVDRSRRGDSPPADTDVDPGRGSDRGGGLRCSRQLRNQNRCRIRPLAARKHQLAIDRCVTFGKRAWGDPGGVFLTLLHARHGEGVNHFLKIVIAILLIVIPIISLLARGSSRSNPIHARGRCGKDDYGVALIGFVVGVLVGVTSIGSGTVTLMLLLVFYGYAPAVLVGTDVVHALLLTGVTALLQMKLGNVDYPLAGYVLIGSIPGGVIGANIANRIPSKRLKQIVFLALITVGTRMFWEGVVHGQ
jgi:hypothetical protein